MRRARNRLALLAATVVALSVGVGAASAGWLGLSDTKYFRYDDPGHVCTDGIDFGVAHPFGAQSDLTVEVTQGLFDANGIFVPEQTILPVTTIGPLDNFDPDLEIGGTPGHWFEFFRLAWTSTPPVGSDIQIEFRTGTSRAATFDVIEDCTRLFFAGFFQPIDNGVFNRMKAGRAVPVKFGLGGDHGLDIFAAGVPEGDDRLLRGQRDRRSDRGDRDRRGEHADVRRRERPLHLRLEDGQELGRLVP